MTCVTRIASGPLYLHIRNFSTERPAVPEIWKMDTLRYLGFVNDLDYVFTETSIGWTSTSRVLCQKLIKASVYNSQVSFSHHGGWNAKTLFLVVAARKV